MKGKLMIGTHLRWMTLLKGKLTKKYKAFKLYKNNRMGSNFSNLQKLSQELSELITKRKEDYNRHLANELNEPQLSPKTFWKILETFYNGNKIPLTPPIIVDKKLVSDYEGKANHFNKFFASQCTPIDNDSQIPDSAVFNTKVKLFAITCEGNDILKIIRNLAISKAHGFDDISVRMVKLGDDFLAKPLSIMFQNCINSGVFPDSWEKSNIVPIHKKKWQTINK